MCCEQMLSALGLFFCYTARIAFAELAIRCMGDSFSAAYYHSSLALHGPHVLQSRAPVLGHDWHYFRDACSCFCQSYMGWMLQVAWK